MLQRTAPTQPCSGACSLWAAQQLPRRCVRQALLMQHSQTQPSVLLHTGRWLSTHICGSRASKSSKGREQRTKAAPGGNPAAQSTAVEAASTADSSSDASPAGLNGSNMSSAESAAASSSANHAAMNGAAALVDAAPAHTPATDGSISGSDSSSTTSSRDGSAGASSSSSSGGTSGSSAGTFIKRVVFGLLLGLGGAAVVAFGSVPYLIVTMLVVYQATQEYYGFITSTGISKGMTPPPPLVSAMTTALCLSIALFTYASKGRVGAAFMSVAAFVLLSLNVMAIKKPTFSQLATSVFGLFYCGYLPSFWIKLRNVSVPAPDLQLPGFLASVPLPHMTIGLVATLTAVACIIAADTGAYFVGKNLGRTKLTDISPKKTVEGALGGMASAVAVALLFRSLLKWPSSLMAAVGFGVLTFISSIVGDLIESIMKRDAGMKDSGDLIPGHGGLLDRFDSYIFTGAVAYFYMALLHFT